MEKKFFYMLSSFTEIKTKHEIIGFCISIPQPTIYVYPNTYTKSIQSRFIIVVFHDGKTSLFSFPATNIAKIILTLSQSQSDIMKKCITNVHKIYNDFKERGRENYVVSSITKPFIFYRNIYTSLKWDKNIKEEIEQIKWIKESVIQNKTKNDYFCVIGNHKDYKIPVMLLRNIRVTVILPFPDYGESIMTSLLYSVYHKPKTRYITKKQYFKILSNLKKSIRFSQ